MKTTAHSPRLAKARAGAIAVGLATAWSVSAAWLSANQVITVFPAEVISYWLAIVTVLVGGSLYLANRGESKTSAQVRGGPLAAALALVIVLASWLESDRVFLFWKLRAIPPGAWPQMVSDLEKVGRRSGEGGAVGIPSGGKSCRTAFTGLGRVLITQADTLRW
jgi:hypothetical protein